MSGKSVLFWKQVKDWSRILVGPDGPLGMRRKRTFERLKYRDKRVRKMVAHGNDLMLIYGCWKNRLKIYAKNDRVNYSAYFASSFVLPFRYKVLSCGMTAAARFAAAKPPNRELWNKTYFLVVLWSCALSLRRFLTIIFWSCKKKTRTEKPLFWRPENRFFGFCVNRVENS
jgi:hypothetical protein